MASGLSRESRPETEVRLVIREDDTTKALSLNFSVAIDLAEVVVDPSKEAAVADLPQTREKGDFGSRRRPTESARPEVEEAAQDWETLPSVVLPERKVAENADRPAVDEAPRPEVKGRRRRRRRRTKATRKQTTVTARNPVRLQREPSQSESSLSSWDEILAEQASVCDIDRVCPHCSDVHLSDRRCRERAQIARAK